LVAGVAALAACSGGSAALPSSTTSASPPTTTTRGPAGVSTVVTTTIPGGAVVTGPFPTARPGIPVGQLPGNGTVDPQITDDRLFLLGDSVMNTMSAANTDEARKVLEPLGWRVTMDAMDGRFTEQAVDVLRQRRRDIGQVVVILIGNNFGGDEKAIGAQFDTMLSLLTGVPKIVFLTVEEFQPVQAEVNRELQRVKSIDRRVTLVDWNSIVRAAPGANRADGLHLTPFGAAVLAGTIADAVGPAPT
jgi:hypothetical protein